MDVLDELLEVLLFAVLSQSLLIIVFDIAEVIVNTCVIIRSRHYALSKKNQFTLATNTFFYRLLQLTMSVMMATGTLLSSRASKATNGIEMLEASFIFRLVSSVLGVWSLLYFVQLLPGIGVFVIIIVHMLSNLFSFLVVFIIFLFPFIHIFMVFFKSAVIPPCVDLFDGYSSSAYSTFSVMLNAVTFLDFRSEVTNMTTLGALHFVFFFIVAVLLVNFLIALFSNTVAHVTVDQEVYTTLEKMTMATIVQVRIGTVAPRIRGLLLRFSKHSFVRLGDKICILCKTPIELQQSCQRNVSSKRIVPNECYVQETDEWDFDRENS
jgi:hypothetical protein